MSVLASQRSESNYNYYYKAVSLRKSITKLLLQDFGIKDNIRSLKNVLHSDKLEEQEYQLVSQICDKYQNKEKALMEYPDWIVAEFRKVIMNTLMQLTQSIDTAEVLTSDQKTYYQELAIASCNTLLQELQYAMDVFPIKAEKLMPYVKQILETKEAIEKWKAVKNPQA